MESENINKSALVFDCDNIYTVVKQAYPEYQLYAKELYREVEGTYIPLGRLLIFKNNKVVADVSSRYKLLPNEVAKSLAEQVMERYNAQCYKVLVNNTNYFGLYTLENIDIEGDEFKLGLMFKNSIDGSTAFSVSMFLVRVMCSNISANIENLVKHKQAYRIYAKHTLLNMQIDNVINNVNNLLSMKNELIEEFVRIRRLKMNERLLTNLSNTIIPNRYMPNVVNEYRERIKNNADTTGVINSANDYAFKLIYDTITENITHSNIDITTQQMYQNALHKAIYNAVEVMQQ